MTSGAPHAVRAVAPVRIADVGGWTDTWFAGHGAVCHLAVAPGIVVDAEFDDGPGAMPVRIVAEGLGEDYRCGPSPEHGWAKPLPGRQPLLEHTIGSVLETVPPTGPLRVTIRSPIPPGASLGTSAAVTVATIAALEALVGTSTGTPGDGDRRHLAGAAHRVETTRVGRESGVQDHWAAAFGGAQLLRITDYPSVERTPIRIDDHVADVLAETMATVVLGPHDSAAIHRGVIETLTAQTRHGPGRTALNHLADLAVTAADRLAAGDIAGWAATLTEATRAQAHLGDGLVGSAHVTLADTAHAHGALGWKVNGAGGGGGSLTVVFASSGDRTAFTDAVIRDHPGWPTFAFRRAAGVTVTPVR